MLNNALNELYITPPPTNPLEGTTVFTSWRFPSPSPRQTPPLRDHTTSRIIERILLEFHLRHDHCMHPLSTQGCRVLSLVTWICRSMPTVSWWTREFRHEGANPTKSRGSARLLLVGHIITRPGSGGRRVELIKEVDDQPLGTVRVCLISGKCTHNVASTTTGVGEWAARSIA